jgi:hypothetical protein
MEVGKWGSGEWGSGEWEETIYNWVFTVRLGGEHLTFVTPKSGFMSSYFESLARNQF